MDIIMYLFVIVAFLIGEIFSRIKLPKLLGYLLFGIFIGNIYNTFSDIESTFIISLALTIVLFKAGLGISLNKLKSVGKRSLLLGIFPNILEAITIGFLLNTIFNIDITLSFATGFIISAVSPAVVIPSMVKLNDNKIGTKSGIPTMNLASASIDDVISITLFTILFESYKTGITSINDILLIPISIISAIVLSIILSFIFNKINKKFKKIKIVISYLMLLSLIIIMKMLHIKYIADTMFILFIGIIIKNYSTYDVSFIQNITNKLWIILQVFLFFIIGTKVIIDNLVDVSIITILIILIGLFVRISISFVCLIKSKFTIKERIFNGICNIPKATVQASLGSIPLIYFTNYDIIFKDTGVLILSISVLSIIITAPIGLILIESFAVKLLGKEE